MPAFHRRAFAKLSFAIAVMGLSLLPLRSGWAATSAALTDAELVKQECGACHYPFARDWLPAYSWKQIIEHLDKHFGENASLDDQTRQRIETYMIGNRSTDIPLRVTEMDWWRNIHGSATVKTYAEQHHFKVSNCDKCHR